MWFLSHTGHISRAQQLQVGSGCWIGQHVHQHSSSPSEGTNELGEQCKGVGKRIVYWLRNGTGGHLCWSDSWQPKGSKWWATNKYCIRGHIGAFDDPMKFLLKMQSQVFPDSEPVWPPRCWAAVNSPQGVLLWSQCGSVNSWRFWGRRETLSTFMGVIPLLQGGCHIWQQFRQNKPYVFF